MDSAQILSNLTARFGGLERCFEKHNFEELNDIDFHTLYKAFLYFLQTFGYEGGAIFDVGCNAGSFVKVLQVFSLQQNIHCFEPHPVISKKTKELYPFVRMNEFCLGNQDGVQDIYIPQWSVGLSSLIYRPVFDQLGQQIFTLNIQCQKLDTYCAENGISEIAFIKIDVEGAEKMIFEGSTNLLKEKKIKCGIFEVGQTLVDAKTSEQEIISLLEGYGYVINRSFSNDNLVFHLPHS
jgi:FkbM family methyltransferase